MVSHSPTDYNDRLPARLMRDYERGGTTHLARQMHCKPYSTSAKRGAVYMPWLEIGYVKLPSGKFGIDPDECSSIRARRSCALRSPGQVRGLLAAVSPAKQRQNCRFGHALREPDKGSIECAAPLPRLSSIEYCDTSCMRACIASGNVGMTDLAAKKQDAQIRVGLSATPDKYHALIPNHCPVATPPRNSTDATRSEFGHNRFG